MQKLLDIMRELRDPQTGCPWDLAQDFRSIYPFTIEEAYEVADAIEREDWPGLQDELGDLLLQVVFHAQMADERGLFTFADVVAALGRKLIRRHPHVFGDHSVGTADAQSAAWASYKQAERQAAGVVGQLDGVAQALPALVRADKLSRRAAGVGFDWPNVEQVRGKVDEELAELDAARTTGDHAAVSEELGDLLVAITNLARHLGVEPEAALRAGNDKFVRRFQAVEKLLARNGEEWSDLGLDDMEERWQSVKSAE